MSGDPSIPFSRSAEAIYRSAKAQSPGAERVGPDGVSRPARPASSVLLGRLGRAISIRRPYTTKHAKAGSRPSIGFPMVKLSLSQSSTPSSRASPRSFSFAPAQQGGDIDSSPSIGARSDRDSTAYIHPPPDDGSGPPLSNTQLPTLDSRKQAFDAELRKDAWLLDEEFPGTSTL